MEKEKEHQHHFDKYCVALSDERLYDKVLIKYCRDCGKIKDTHFFPNKKTVQTLIKKEICFKLNGAELITTEYVPKKLLEK